MIEKYYVTWEEILERLHKFDVKYSLIYGVPKGGAIITGHLQYAHNEVNPVIAEIILDDLIDSGKTRDLYQKQFPNIPFFTLFDKQTEEKLKGKWVVFPWENTGILPEDTIQDNITRTLQYIGEDPMREGLLKTPERVVRSWSHIFSGYNKNPEDILTVFNADGYADTYDEIVLLKDIEIYSMCEHHMLPFFGKAHIAYIPDKKIVGISKLARLIDIYARRLQIQERIGDQVTTTLMELLQPKGAACIIEATHMCMRMRGVEKQNSIMTTSSMKGAFIEKAAAREELMQLIRR